MTHTIQAVFIEDLGSMHGTFVNECRIEANRALKLAVGDSIRFGAEVSRGPGMSI